MRMLFISCIIAQLLLAIWFLGCICTYKVGKYVLVEGEGIKSPEFVMLCLYSIGMFLFSLFPIVGKWLLLVVLIYWVIIQFFCHWYYTIVGVSDEKLSGYNEYFKNTVHIIPTNDKALIPDLYHCILHLLLLILSSLKK